MGQDDFWDEAHNPAISILRDYKDFIKDPERKIYFDEQWIQEAKIRWYRDKQGPYVMAKDLFVWEIEQQARNVKNMKVYTWEQWQKVKDTFVCPECGSKNLDID